MVYREEWEAAAAATRRSLLSRAFEALELGVLAAEERARAARRALAASRAAGCFARWADVAEAVRTLKAHNRSPALCVRACVCVRVRACV